MRIGIDARFYGPKTTGPGRYVQKLIEHLQEIDRENTYFIFLRRDQWEDFYKKQSNFKKILADYPWYSLTEQIFLPRIIARQKLDLMHFPHFNVPIFYRERFIVTIHDLIITSFPTKRATTLGAFRYAIKRRGYEIVISRAARRAERILTVSNFSKQEIAKHFNLPDDRIVVTLEAVDSPLLSSMTREDLRKRFEIKKPFLLYVGNTYPHKNLERFLVAFQEIVKKEQCDVQFVLVGKDDYFSRRLQREKEKLRLGDSVIFTGFVSDQDLGGFYRNAMLYVFPSLLEGFGLPPLEAMSYGLPVVSSSASCLPEILGDAAAYFNPLEIRDMIKVLKELIHSFERREALRIKGLERIRRFSWKTMAEQTHGVYLHSFPPRR